MVKKAVLNKINFLNTYQHIISYVEKPNISPLFSLASADDKSLTSTFNKHNFLLSFNPCVWIKLNSIFLIDSLGSTKKNSTIKQWFTLHYHNNSKLTRHQIQLNNIVFTVGSPYKTSTG